MSKTFGIIALIFSIIGVVVIILATIIINMLLLLSMGFISIPIPIIITIDTIPLACVVVAIVCGAIGIKKDDSRGLAIAGLIIGSIVVIPYIVVLIIVFGPSIIPTF